MTSSVSIGSFSSIEEASVGLQKALASTMSNRPNPGSAFRWEAVVPDTEPLAWLNHHDNLVRMYCSNRERRLQIAAIGVADMLRYKDGETELDEALRIVFSRLQKLPDGMRFYGGMRFAAEVTQQDPTWQRFGRVRFVLPAVELLRDDAGTTMAMNLIVSDEPAREMHQLAGILQSLSTPPTLSAAHLPLPMNRVNLPDRDRWEHMVEIARRQMTAGTLKKIVLARRCMFDFGESLHPMALLQRLHEASPDSFHFCFNYGNEIAFIGATPERLYQRLGVHLLSEALAGTRPRGATDDDDRWLESELMASAKERNEHQLVADAIVETLSRYCTNVQRRATPEILKLQYVQHLRTVISGELKEPVSDADLLLALHPTPAMGGWPKAEAMQAIADLEPFDRGWYAAPIGWVKKDEAEFAVAIRCALVEGSRLSLFSGAGIMPESDSEQEWREIESKIGNFLRILTS